MKFICYPRCTTCQRAKKWLDDNGVAYELRDIKLENPTVEELSAWYEKSGLPLKKFFNTSGLLYKSLDLKNKLPGMSDREMLELLASDGMLVKRPILVGDGFVLLGFKEEEYAKISIQKKGLGMSYAPRLFSMMPKDALALLSKAQNSKNAIIIVYGKALLCGKK